MCNELITNNFAFTYILTILGLLLNEVITTGRWLNLGDFLVGENIMF
jgi:hypothetical protein